MEVGKNVKLSLEGESTLVLKVDLTQTFGESSTGKSITVASGNLQLGTSGIRLGLNVYTKLKEKFDKAGLKDWKDPGGENIEWSLNGTILTMKCDVTKEGSESKNGSSILIASTRGPRKLAKSNVTVGLNVTTNGKTEINPAKMMTGAPSHNMKLEADPQKKIIRAIIGFNKTFTEKVKSGNSYMISSSLGAYQCPDPFKDLKLTFTMTCKDSKMKTEPASKPAPLSANCRGVTYTMSPEGIMTILMDATGDYGETSSGVSTTVASATGKLACGNGNVTLTLYRRDPDKKLPSKATDVKESGKKRSASKALPAPFSKIKKIVKEFVDADESEDLTIGTIRRALCKKQKWDDEDPELKKAFKKAITEVYDEDEDGEDE
eukprot:TRINITY_DN1448_c0_g1_i1.p1 TRINITY_DN1448_c0_g1~~TRINITY_DN1448_c0_g1_i1.p1  ORF type:complete len:394 (+),score=78.55 TRINITY_DN1448_c0_g1_i1:54-1184(+)